jgi:YgiT-type zinc finger domain-containing protein
MAGELQPDFEVGVDRFACPDCLAGKCRMTRRTFFTWVQEDLITVQNFPAWVCDFCGWRKFDSRAVLWLKTLLHPPRKQKSSPKLSSWSVKDEASDGHQPLSN